MTSYNIEGRLLANILQNYSMYVRPVNNTLEAIVVTFHMNLRQVIQINERAQTLTAQVDFTIEWGNAQLKWDPKKWGGVETLYSTKEQVWVPALTILNNAHEKAPEPHKGTDQVILEYTGSNKWYPIVTITVSFTNNIRYFPFDLQKCVFVFESWILDESKLRIKAASYSQVSQYYVPSPEWNIQKTEKSIHKKIYPEEINAYYQIHFSYYFLRKPNYYVITLILPCILLLLIILFSHFLPPGSGERMGVVITILLAFAVFLEAVSASMPPNSDSTSVLSMFYLITMTLCALSFLATCIVLTVSYHDSKTTYPPTWVRKYILRTITKTTSQLQNDVEIGNCVTMYNVTPATKHQNGDLRKQSKFDTTNAVTELTTTPAFSAEISTVISHLNKIITKQEEHLDWLKKDVIENTKTAVKHDHYDDIEREWKDFAAILDRISFWLFLILFITSSLAILVPAYEKYHSVF